MPETQTKKTIQQISMSNTKKEMIEAYDEVLKQLKEKRETELKPQSRIEEKQKEEAVQLADSLSTEGIEREVGNLRAEIGKVLNDLSERMEKEIGKYRYVKKAVESKEHELKEIYEIQKEAMSLAALIDAQKDKCNQFEIEMSEKKRSLEAEIDVTRETWKAECNAHEAEVRGREEAEKKKREREAEEHTYNFERQKQLSKEQFEYDTVKMERELQLRREELEMDLTAREKALKEKESEFESLRERVGAFTGELSAAVDKTVKETTANLKHEFEIREALMKKEFEGEQKVLQSRIESLQQTVKEQQQQIAKLSAQIEKSYTQVQDIAVKAIEGSGNVRILSSSPTVQSEKRGTGKED